MFAEVASGERRTCLGLTGRGCSVSSSPCRRPSVCPSSSQVGKKAEKQISVPEETSVPFTFRQRSPQLFTPARKQTTPEECGGECLDAAGPTSGTDLWDRRDSCSLGSNTHRAQDQRVGRFLRRLVI